MIKSSLFTQESFTCRVDITIDNTSEPPAEYTNAVMDKNPVATCGSEAFMLSSWTGAKMSSVQPDWGNTWR